MYKCKFCQKEFESRSSLAGHTTHCKENPNYERNKVNCNNFGISSRAKLLTETCPYCKEEFTSTKSGITFHINRCKENPNRKIHPGNKGNTAGYRAWNKGLTAKESSSIAVGAEKRIKQYASGELQGSFTGRKHSSETKRKLRILAIEHIEELGPVKCNYSKNGCKLMNELNIQNNWHLQHAENGGEFYIDGYWLDGYDKELNIAFEYDEPRHYKDVMNNILSDKDVERQNNIINALQCKFYRYNQYLEKLYEVQAPSVNG